jgi:shikimate dehydrogenase
MSKNFGVVGDPIEHSKSPVIHSAAYKVLNLDYQYTKVRVEKNHLMQFVETLDESWSGLSVTAPLKNEAFRLSKVADEISQLTGASNTLLRKGDAWHSFNTDVFGIRQALDSAAVEKINSAAVIGSGATAVSAVLALSQSYPQVALTLTGRNRAAIAELVVFAKRLGVKSVRVANTVKALSTCDLVVSTLPSGVLDTEITKLSSAWLRNAKGVLFDVAYDPWPSAAAKHWLESNLKVISGVEMLLWQAIAQVRIFNSGSPTEKLPNEAAVMLAMRDSIGLI